MKIHIVKPGDTLYKLCEKYNVELDKLIAANPQIPNPDVLDVGMKVKVPNAPKPLQPPTDYLYKHVVQQGDTLWKLGKAWGIPLAAMVAANPQLKNPNVLMTGELVYIPKPSAAADASQQPKADTSMLQAQSLPTEMAPVSETPLPELPVELNEAPSAAQQAPMMQPPMPNMAQQAPVMQPPMPNMAQQSPVMEQAVPNVAQQAPVMQSPMPNMAQQLPYASNEPWMQQPAYGAQLPGGPVHAGQMPPSVDLFQQYEVPAVEAGAQPWGQEPELPAYPNMTQSFAAPYASAPNVGPAAELPYGMMPNMAPNMPPQAELPYGMMPNMAPNMPPAAELPYGMMPNMAPNMPPAAELPYGMMPNMAPNMPPQAELPYGMMPNMAPNMPPAAELPYGMMPNMAPNMPPAAELPYGMMPNMAPNMPPAAELPYGMMPNMAPNMPPAAELPYGMMPNMAPNMPPQAELPYGMMPNMAPNMPYAAPMANAPYAGIVGYPNMPYPTANAPVAGDADCGCGQPNVPHPYQPEAVSPYAPYPGHPAHGNEYYGAPMVPHMTGSYPFMDQPFQVHAYPGLGAMPFASNMPYPAVNAPFTDLENEAPNMPAAESPLAATKAVKDKDKRASKGKRETRQASAQDSLASLLERNRRKAEEEQRVRRTSPWLNT
ncbi:LysM peptidoglycan-binding domain-containing protein [Paenibacillus sp. YYML68]|uniref:LysM peptidoglycan-binding domain-containing protein n=1 Tax=Paenibacillus sp. YYML68 TaxID=2909250 RepID=UPI00248FF697|nr:LysM peptidoglycan-binding domain-containing protein [Paenibacillus sp. YYML68]